MIGNEIPPDWATSTEKQTNNHQWMLELGAEANSIDFGNAGTMYNEYTPTKLTRQTSKFRRSFQF